MTGFSAKIGRLRDERGVRDMWPPANDRICTVQWPMAHGTEHTCNQPPPSTSRCVIYADINLCKIPPVGMQGPHNLALCQTLTKTFDSEVGIALCGVTFVTGRGLKSEPESILQNGC